MVGVDHQGLRITMAILRTIFSIVVDLSVALGVSALTPPAVRVQMAAKSATLMPEANVWAAVDLVRLINKCHSPKLQETCCFHHLTTHRVLRPVKYFPPFQI